MNEEPLRLPQQEELLRQSLRALLGDTDDALIARIGERVQWRSLVAGEVLMAQGDPGDAMFVTLSGRLRVNVRDAEGAERVLREVGRGEVLGEMSLITDEARSATVTAMRDSLLARLDKQAFHELLAASPELSLALTRQIVRRLQSADVRRGDARPVTVALVPVSSGVDAAAFADELAAAIRQQPERNRVAVIGGADVRHALGAGTDDHRRVALLLDELEARRIADLVFEPPLHRVGMLDWKSIERVAEQGYRHAREVLAAQPATGAL